MLPKCFKHFLNTNNDIDIYFTELTKATKRDMSTSREGRVVKMRQYWSISRSLSPL